MKQQQVLVWWLAVSLTIGMTSISSAEGDNDDRKVLAFTLEDCQGNSREFENLKALEDFDKKSNNDSTGEDYESYMYVDDDSNTCHTLENEDMEELTVVGERLPQDDEEIPDTGDIRETTIKIPRVIPADVRFDDQDLAETNEKWKGCKDRITDVEGYDLEYEETDYTWETSMETGLNWGLTDPNTETVTIYPVNIAQMTPLGFTVPHLTMQTVLHEYIHTIQGRSGTPDEWLYQEYEAHNLSYYWYKAIFRKNPPLKPYSEERFEAIRKSDKYKSDLKNVERWYEKSKRRNLSKSEREDFNNAILELIGNLSDHALETFDPNYDTEDLECESNEE
ncbi:MAG: hypothetical protein OXH84_05480 [Gammaproteobacteria bacterium]|nr:hypothetical protein [Gammaproteobacteria bacterium]